MGEKDRQPRVIACCGGMVIVAGLERMTFEALGALRALGGCVHCIVNSWENHRITALAEKIGATWSTGYYRYRLDRRARSPLKVMQILWDIALTSSGLLRDAWKFKPTHVLLPEFTAALRNAPALALLRMLGVRVVLRLGNAPDPGTFYRRVWRWVIDRVVDDYVANSRFTQHALLAHGISAAKSRLIYNTVPARSPQEGKSVEADPRKVVFVGQINPEKGLHVLLEAVALLVSRGHDVVLDVIGQIDGWVPEGYIGYREAILKRASEADLHGRVNFLGWREDVPAILAGAAVHCCPSMPEQREAFGIVNIEAKQAGIPSVVTAVGALPELIEHRSDGWICSEPSAAAIAEGIEYFLTQPALRHEAGLQARVSLEKFVRGRFCELWQQVFSMDVQSYPGERHKA